jgi:hypothetical protein
MDRELLGSLVTWVVLQTTQKCMGFNVRYDGVFEGFGIVTTMGGHLYA